MPTTGGRLSHPVQVADPMADLVLPPEIRANGPPRAADTAPRVVLVTGATGFVGGYLCRDLLLHTPARVLCLVRGATPDQARARLHARLAEVGTDPDLLERVTAIPGDMSRPRLGLSADAYDRLSGLAEAIYHSAASTNMAASYSRIKPVNVTATLEVLRLAANLGPKPVHFLSTIGVALAARQAGGVTILGEDDEVPIAYVPQIGYEISKWVCEHLMRAAHSRGIPTTVYRPPLILGHSLDGVGSSNDAVALFIGACVQLGATPDNDKAVPVCTVDYVSRALVALSTTPGLAGHVYNLNDPEPLQWRLAFERLRAMGHDLENVPYALWRQRLQDHHLVQPARAVAAMPELMSFLLSDDPRYNLPRYSCANTLGALALHDPPITAPPIDARYLDRVLNRTIVQRPSGSVRCPEFPAAHRSQTSS